MTGDLKDTILDPLSCTYYRQTGFNLLHSLLVTCAWSEDKSANVSSLRYTNLGNNISETKIRIFPSDSI